MFLTIAAATQLGDNVIDIRQSQLKDWFERTTGINNAALETVSADASFRRYFRVLVGDSSYILVDAPPQSEKNNEFVEFASSYAQAGLDVPRVLHAEFSNGFLCLTDLGSQTLLPLLSNFEKYWYSKAISLLPNIANVTVIDEQSKYDAEFFTIECNLFVEWFCKKFLEITQTDLEQYSLIECFNELITSALEQPQVTTHRDFHARNIMVRDNQSLAIIDFQDTVTGPLTYDVVSLLKDCYFKLEKEDREALLKESFELYRAHHLVKEDYDTYKQWFDFMGLQRHLKVCGIFSRLHLRDQKSHYLADLPLVVEYVVEVCEQYKQLSPLLNLFNTQILPHLTSKVTQCTP